MKKTLQKGRRDFTERLINYAIEGGALSRCKEHPQSIYRTGQEFSGAYAVVKKAWQKGEISSDLSGAQSQLDEIMSKAPERCSFVRCWSKP